MPQGAVVQHGVIGFNIECSITPLFMRVFHYTPARISCYTLFFTVQCHFRGPIWLTSNSCVAWVVMERYKIKLRLVQMLWELFLECDESYDHYTLKSLGDKVEY